MLINHESFLEKLQLVAKTAAGTDKVPIYKTICMSKGMISTYDGICGTAVKFDTGVRACVDAGHLLQVIKAVDQDFNLTQDESSGLLRIAAAGFKQEIPCIADSGFPDFIPKTYTQILGADSGLAGGLKLLLKLTTERASIPQYAGVGINGQYLFVTDGNRATRYQLQGSVSGLWSIPLSSARKIAGDVDPVYVVANRNALCCMYAQHLFVTQLNAVDVPVTAIGKQMLPADPHYNVELPEQLGIALNRCSLFSNDRASGTRMRSMKNQLVINSAAKGKGAAEEIVSSPFPFEFDIHVNADNMIDAMAITRKVNLEKIVRGEANYMRFEEGRLTHIVCLMSPTI